MKRYSKIALIISHVLLVALILLIFRQGERKVDTNIPFLVAIVIIEALYIIQFLRQAFRKKEYSGAPEIMIIVYGFMLLWELTTTQFNILNVTLYPAPEIVFNVFVNKYEDMLINAFYSLQLILIGFTELNPKC